MVDAFEWLWKIRVALYFPHLSLFIWGQNRNEEFDFLLVEMTRVMLLLHTRILDYLSKLKSWFLCVAFSFLPSSTVLELLLI